MIFILEEEDVEYYKHDKNMPIYGYTVLDLPTILRICFNGNVSPTVAAKKQQIRVNETITFVLSQSQVDTKHPFDLDADQIGGAFIKNDKVRFYECEFDDEGDLTYNEVHIKKDSDGKVTSGYVNLRKGKMWEERVADMEKIVVIIRRRAENKETKLKDAGSLIRNNLFVMDLDEYNDSYVLLRSKSRYSLNHSFVIISYTVNTDVKLKSEDTICYIERSHRNSTRSTTKVFRSLRHSSKVDARQSLAADKRAPRLILDDIEESSDSIMNLTSGISDIKQIYNYRYNYQTNHKDEYSVLLGMCFEQNDSSFDLLDKEQGFIREINFRIVKKPSIVLFLNQTIVDLNRFCTMNAPSNYFSPLSTNTTYQIAEHYLTQTAHENLSALRRDTLKSPWFPGVCMLHREEAFENFAYLWQVAKRSNSSLSSLRVLGTDDDKAIYDTYSLNAMDVLIIYWD